jgi:DNA-binding NarL/FixJ family response regulator
MSVKAPSVMLVDDHTMLRQGLRRSLETEGIPVIAEASNGEEAVRLALESKPNVVLMDVSMPQIDGIEATRRLMAADARQRVVILTMHIDRDVIERAMKAGAVGYMTKDSTVKEVVLAVKLAANGDRILSPRLAEVMLQEAKKVDDIVPGPMLSPREEELLQHIADGLATSEVAEKMFISQKTVKNHLASIYEKLQARDRTQAVLMAVKMGIVKLN